MYTVKKGERFSRKMANLFYSVGKSDIHDMYTMWYSLIIKRRVSASLILEKIRCKRFPKSLIVDDLWQKCWNSICTMYIPCGFYLVRQSIQAVAAKAAAIDWPTNLKETVDRAWNVIGSRTFTFHRRNRVLANRLYFYPREKALFTFYLKGQ